MRELKGGDEIALFAGRVFTDSRSINEHFLACIESGTRGVLLEDNSDLMLDVRDQLNLVLRRILNQVLRDTSITSIYRMYHWAARDPGAERRRDWNWERREGGSVTVHFVVNEFRIRIPD